MDPKAPNLGDAQAVDFKDLHCTMDIMFRSLREEGIGAEVRHASLISKEE